MQGCITSLLLFLFLCFLFFHAPLCLTNSSLKITKVVPVFELKTWMEAQNCCRENYSNLVTFTNTLESSKLDMYEGWTGMYMAPNNEWKGSTDSDQPGKVQWCLYKNQSNLEVKNCHHIHPFLCMETLILVQEVNTWEEALQYCRELHAVESTGANITPMYDLASLPDANNILMNAEATTLYTPTNEVWVGLRFLAAEWMWLSGEVVTGSHLPHCPAQDQHCGALDQNNTQWKIMNCSERRNFICSIKKNMLQRLRS